MKVVLILSAIVLAAYAGSCPASHPYVYYNGHYCCASNREKHYKPQGWKCDGSLIGRSSLCCQGNRFVKCPSGICGNFKRLRSMNSLSSSEARVENNVDYWGADIRSFRSRGLRDCYNACRRTKGCRSFTMLKRNNYCWLKRKVNGARRMTNKGHLISANLVMRSARMKVYRSYIVRYKRAAAIQRKRLRGYTLRYNKAHAAAVINARWTNKMVRLANANAKAANIYHRRYTIYRRKFMAVRAGCIKAQRKWAGVANAQVKAQRVMIARMKVYRKKAALYKRRYLASLKLFRTRAKQRKAAYALYNKYIKTSNYWVKRYNVVARG